MSGKKIMRVATTQKETKQKIMAGINLKKKKKYKGKRERFPALRHRLADVTKSRDSKRRRRGWACCCRPFSFLSFFYYHLKTHLFFSNSLCVDLLFAAPRNLKLRRKRKFYKNRLFNQNNKITDRLPWFFLILMGRVVEEVVAEDEEEPDGVGLLP